MSINVKKEENYVVLKFMHSSISEKDVLCLWDELKKYCNDHSSFILDFSIVHEFRQEALAPLKDLASYCLDENLSIVLFGQEDIHQLFMDYGLGYLIPSYLNLDEAKGHFKNFVKMQGDTRENNNFTQAIIRAAEFTVETMFQLKPVVGQIFEREKDTHLPFDIASVACLSTERCKVIFIIGFSRMTLLNFMKRMLEEEHLEFGDVVKSGATELLNCLMGILKKDIQEYPIYSGIPSLLQGSSQRNGTMQIVVNDHSTIIPFSSEGGDFFIEFVAYRKKEEE